MSPYDRKENESRFFAPEGLRMNRPNQQNSPVKKSYPLNGSSDRHSDDSWHVLRRLAQGYLAQLHLQHPEWSVAQAIVHLAARRTPTLVLLLQEAGFTTSATAADIEAVVQADAQQRMAHGAPDWKAVELKTGVPLAEIERVLSIHGGYGVGAYGQAPYGGKHQRSQSGTPVSRQVTANGQFSYAGKQYGVGRQYQGCFIQVRERVDHLDVECINGQKLRFSKR